MVEDPYRPFPAPVMNCRKGHNLGRLRNLDRGEHHVELAETCAALRPPPWPTRSMRAAPRRPRAAAPALRAVALVICSAEAAAERQLGFAWHAEEAPSAKTTPEGPTISAGTTDALPGRQCEYHCHFDWYGNCYDQSCYDCVGCVQLRTPRPPPAPRYPPPPTPMQVVKPLWCLELSGRGDALKQDPPLMCPELDYDDCSKFYVFFHGVSIPCMWTEVRRRAASTLDRSPLSALLSQLTMIPAVALDRACARPLTSAWIEASPETSGVAGLRHRRRALRRHHRRTRRRARRRRLTTRASRCQTRQTHLRHRRRHHHHRRRSSARTVVTTTSMRAATTAGSMRASSTRHTIAARWHRRRSTAAAS